MDRLAKACIIQSHGRMFGAQRHYLKMCQSTGAKWEYENQIYGDMLASAKNWQVRAEKLKDVPFLSSSGPIVFSPENFDVLVGIAGRVFNTIFMVESDLLMSAFLDMGEDAEKIIIKKVREVETELVGLGLLNRDSHILKWGYDYRGGLLSLSLICENGKE